MFSPGPDASLLDLLSSMSGFLPPATRFFKVGCQLKPNSNNGSNHTINVSNPSRVKNKNNTKTILGLLFFVPRW